MFEHINPIQHLLWCYLAPFHPCSIGYIQFGSIMEGTTHLFTYGTLMSELLLNSVLSNSVLSSKQSQKLKRMDGILRDYKRFCVKNQEYPAIIYSTESVVRGIIYELPKSYLEFLDLYEGKEYKRILLTVENSKENSKENLDAWAYVWIDSNDELIDREWDFDKFIRKEKQFRENDEYFKSSVSYDTGIRH